MASAVSGPPLLRFHHLLLSLLFILLFLSSFLLLNVMWHLDSVNEDVERKHRMEREPETNDTREKLTESLSYRLFNND